MQEQPSMWNALMRMVDEGQALASARIELGKVELQKAALLCVRTLLLGLAGIFLLACSWLVLVWALVELFLGHMPLPARLSIIAGVHGSAGLILLAVLAWGARRASTKARGEP